MLSLSDPQKELRGPLWHPRAATLPGFLQSQGSYAPSRIDVARVGSATQAPAQAISYDDLQGLTYLQVCVLLCCQPLSLQNTWSGQCMVPAEDHLFCDMRRRGSCSQSNVCSMLSQVKGSGIANTCPVIEGGSSNLKDLKAGTYKIQKFCMEPTSFKVKEESQFKGGDAEFAPTKLMTRLTYTLDEVRRVSANAVLHRTCHHAFVHTAASDGFKTPGFAWRRFPF